MQHSITGMTKRTFQVSSLAPHHTLYLRSGGACLSGLLSDGAAPLFNRPLMEDRRSGPVVRQCRVFGPTLQGTNRTLPTEQRPLKGSRKSAHRPCSSSELIRWSRYRKDKHATGQPMGRLHAQSPITASGIRNTETKEDVPKI